MSNEIRNLEPKALWNNFADLNAVPRPSKKEGRVIEFIKKFGESLGLPTSVDETGNVIIKKPASAGMENRETVCLQSHLDMVHQKNNDTNFDFNTEGIQMYVDGDWVRAKGTTLGADNGIGVSTIMSILASKDIAHPSIEALFTIDEETGMTGAIGLKGSLLHAGILLNLDTEDDHELTIGCAGGVDVTANGNYYEEKAPTDTVGYLLTFKGLAGGHSGMEIHLGKGNANKLINRILQQASENFGIRVSSIDGGGLRNAIPRESKSELVVPKDKEADFKKFVESEAAVLKKEYATTDPGLQVVLEPKEITGKVLSKEFQDTLLRAIYAAPNGIFRMSPDIKDLVQTSNNVARVLVKDSLYTIQNLTRSSVDSEKMDLAREIRCTFELTGAKVDFNGSYSGWTPKPETPIVKLMAGLYRDMFKSEPLVDACHAGLECGIIGTNYPNMQMISFGPNILGAHSPDERVQISSVQKFWGFVIETLGKVGEKM